MLWYDTSSLTLLRLKQSGATLQPTSHGNIQDDFTRRRVIILSLGTGQAEYVCVVPADLSRRVVSALACRQPTSTGRRLTGPLKMWEIYFFFFWAFESAPKTHGCKIDVWLSRLFGSSMRVMGCWFQACMIMPFWARRGRIPGSFGRPCHKPGAPTKMPIFDSLLRTPGCVAMISTRHGDIRHGCATALHQSQVPFVLLFIPKCILMHCLVLRVQRSFLRNLAALSVSGARKQSHYGRR